MRRRRKSRKAPCVVAVTKTESGIPCVYTQCTRSGIAAGPVLGANATAMKACLAKLSLVCDCGAISHFRKYIQD